MNSNSSSYFNLIDASFSLSKEGGLWTIFNAVFLLENLYKSIYFLGI